MHLTSGVHRHSYGGFGAFGLPAFAIVYLGIAAGTVPPVKPRKNVKPRFDGLEGYPIAFSGVLTAGYF